MQVYAGWADPSPDQPLRRLCGFRRVALEPGARERVAVDVALEDLAWFDADAGHWRLGAEPLGPAVAATSNTAVRRSGASRCLARCNTAVASLGSIGGGWLSAWAAADPATVSRSAAASLAVHMPAM